MSRKLEAGVHSSSASAVVEQVRQSAVARVIALSTITSPVPGFAVPFSRRTKEYTARFIKQAPQVLSSTRV